MSGEAPKPQKLIVVSGPSGAGRSTAINVLEDLGFEAIDNVPMSLIPRLTDGPLPAPLAIGIDVRNRDFSTSAVMDMLAQLQARPDVDAQLLYLDADEDALVRRYSETRRRHPMAQGRPLQDGISAERELLEPMRRWADLIIDTSNLATNQLQQHIRELFGVSTEQPMTVTISSFGFARGMPPLADLVFDMRFLDNPHWVEELREQTGLDAPVAEHIRKDPGLAPSIERIEGLITDLLPRYAAQGKSYVHIAFGCTGGRHRSVFTAELMAEALRAHGFSPTVRHRNLSSRAADAVEEMKR